MAHVTIPSIDIGALFGPPGNDRDSADRAIHDAARDVGFMVVTGLPAFVPLGQRARQALLRVFELGPGERKGLWRQKFEPANPNIYRGWFPVQPGNLTSKEGIDIGGDVAHGHALVVAGDPLREATPLPCESRLPGWRESCADYYRAMERVSGVLMHSLSRSLGLPEAYFDSAFQHGLSTLRLLHYPVRHAAELAVCDDPGLWVDGPSGRRYVTGAAHSDSGFLTLLAQDGVSGLQARWGGADWVDVPPADDGLVVNFGQVLEQWCAGRIRATQHRVVGNGRERHSVPFFYEARADALISPLPLDSADAFAPFAFGDYLWRRITQFVEFRGMQALRKPQVPIG